jgi:hypothetical protein
MLISYRTFFNLKSICLLCLLSFLLGCSGAQSSLKKEEVLSRARNGYYSLHSQGVKNFQASVTPNWRAMFNGTDTEKVSKGIAILSRVHFAINYDSSGEVSIAHTPDIREFGPDYDQFVDGTEKQIEGFFQAIQSLGYLSALFPSEDSLYSMEENPSEYLISIGEADNIETTSHITKSFIISEVDVKSAAMRMSIITNFTSNSGGRILSNIQAHIDQNQMTADFSGTLEYQYVDGVLVPKKLRITMPAMHSNLECTFNDYHITAGAQS